MSFVAALKRNIFREKNEVLELPDGMRISQVIRRFGLAGDEHLRIWLNGERVTQGQYPYRRCKAGDTISIMVVPAAGTNINITGGKNPALSVLGLLTGAGAMFLPRLWNRNTSTTAAAQSSEVSPIDNNDFSPPPDPLPEPEPTPVAGIGGPKDTLVPRVVAYTNQNGAGLVIPRVFGTYRMRPPIAAAPFTYTEGSTQWLHVVYCFGFSDGGLEISDLKVGDRSLDDLIAQVGGAYYLGEMPILYTNDVAEGAVNLPLLYDQPVSIRALQAASTLSFDISFDRGLAAYDSNGLPTPTTVALKYRYKKSSETTYSDWVSVSFTDVSDRLLFRTVNVVLDPEIYGESVVDIEVVRDTPDSTVDTLVNGMTWTVLRAIRPGRPIRYVKAINGAEENSVLYLDLRIQLTPDSQNVLTDLNALASSRLRCWDGGAWDFTLAPSSNPAWVFASMLTGKWFKERLSLSRLDHEGIAEWAAFCNEKGYTFNYVYDQGTTLLEALRQVCAAGRASPTLVEGKYSVLIDTMRDTVVQHFTPRNSRNFRGKRQYPDVPEVLRIGFVNTERGYVQDERKVYDDDFDATNTDKSQEVQYVGVTTASHAWQLGRYQIACARLRPERYTVDTDVENLVCTRGDLVKLVHDVPLLGAGQGRIKSIILNEDGDITGITIDNTIVMQTGKAYMCRIRLQDGSALEGNIMLVVGDSQEITLEEAIPTDTDLQPEIGDLVLFAERQIKPINMVVESIEHTGNLNARLTLVDYSPSIYSADTGPIPPFDSQITFPHPSIRHVPNPRILSVVSDETVLIRQAGAILNRIVVNLLPPGDPAVAYFQYQYRLSGAVTNWSPAQISNAADLAVSIIGVQNFQTYNIQIRSVTGDNNTSEWVSVTHTVVGTSTRPPDVPVLEQNANSIFVRYDPSVGIIAPLDFAGIHWKFAFGANDNWEQAITLHALTTDLSISVNSLPPGLVTVMAKAVDISGNESLKAAVLIRNLGDPVRQNEIIEIPHSPDFILGAYDNASVVDEELVANDSGDLFWSGSNNALFWSGNDSNLFYSVSYQPFTYRFSYTPSFDTNKPFFFLFDYIIAAEGYTVEYRKPGSTAFWGGDDNRQFWSGNDSNQFWTGGEPAWVPYTGPIDGTWERIEGRITIFASALEQGKIKLLKLLIDVPDIVEYLDNVEIADAGTRLPIAQTYRTITTCNLTLQYDAINYPDAANAVCIDKNVDGPLIRVIDANGDQTAGVVDAIVRGY